MSSSQDGVQNMDHSNKRQRLSDSLTAGKSSAVSSVQDSVRRDDCRFASSCYRRNESHLLQYRHQLLEDAYRSMVKSNDFTKVPSGLAIGDGDESVLLEQANILRGARFQIPSQDDSNVAVAAPHDSGKESNNPVEADRPSTSSSTKKDPLAELFEERKRRMRAKEMASEKVKAQSNPNLKGTNPTAVVPNNSGSMASKWIASCPFNIFLTKVRDVPTEKPGVLSANFTDLFDPSLGEVKAVCHINFMVEANWLFNQTIKAGLEGKPTRIIYGEDNKELEEGAKAFTWLKIFRAKSPFPFGHHHTKMSFVQYTDKSVRFYVYTANLVESDWDNRTQGIWISPKCPRVPAESSASHGESPTKFREDIMDYLTSYPVQATAAWRDVIKYTDCSSIKTFFVASVPVTSQSNHNGFKFGIKKMEKILKSFEMDTEPDWQLTVQCSSIGTLGTSANDWLTNEFGAAMSGKDRLLRGPLNLVYPSDANVKSSFDGALGGGCLPYSAMTHMKQRWLERHMFQWKADCSGRSRAPPHIKSYSRWSPDQTKMAWFLLTSANISKAAWGKVNKHGDRLTVMSWEAGVLFVPELISPSKYFKVETTGSPQVERFPLYFDIPLVKYEKKDHPWFFETLQLAISE